MTSFGLGAEYSLEVGNGVQISGHLTKGATNEDVLGNVFNYSFSETFSTSSDPIFTGHDGDVYIGKATNQRFSIARVLRYDTTTCTASIQNRPNLEETGIATTFMYAEKHVESVLIPQLEWLGVLFDRQAVRATDPDTIARYQAEADSFRMDASNWQGIVAKNALNRDSLAEDLDKNISFSAGSPYESTITFDTTSYNYHEYTDYVDAGLNVGAAWIVKVGVWFEGSAGIAGNFRKETKMITNHDTTTSFTVGYHLEDSGFGDYFSVDILQDTFYNVPAFRLWGGTSSCPHEPGTQPRDKANIVITPPRVDNVAPGKLAHFTTTLTNRSESFEQR
jgi:hypothetical protein